jgi:hypothetical protein
MAMDRVKVVKTPGTRQALRGEFQVVAVIRVAVIRVAMTPVTE